jgi:S-adenosylmethionine hydrolase
MADSAHIITLLTDFGLRDHYTASMKGVMLGLNPDLNFVDISHSVPPQDISSAAFILGQAYPCFPAGTIHLAIVDPGVGTARKEIVVAAAAQVFVGPDNGIFTWVFEREESFTVYEITADHYFRKPVSSTFHGRDIFAPVAGWISRNIPLQQLGPVCQNPVRLKIPALTRVRDTLIQATVLAVDGFGNLITNLKPEDLPLYSAGGSRTCKMLVSQREITNFRITFGEGAAGEIFVLPGSSGYLEIVMRNGSAAATLNATAGAPVGVVLS